MGKKFHRNVSQLNVIIGVLTTLLLLNDNSTLE